MSLAELTAEIKKIHGAPTDPTPEQLAKVTTQGIQNSTGLAFYDLQPAVKGLYPVLTPLRNMIPRVSGNGGNATNWKAITAINATNVQPFVPEASRNAVISTSEVDNSAAYKSVGLEDSITFEARNAAVGLTPDQKADVSARLLNAALIQEEWAFIGGNGSMSLATPTAPTTATATTGGTIAAATYNVIVIALTFQGLNTASLAGGVSGVVSVTTADGSTFNVGGASSNKSSATAQVTTGATSTISASTPVVQGAVGYAWYVGTAGNEKLEAITTRNSVLLTALAGTGQNASAITTNNSQNALAYDGFLTQALKAGNNGYFKALATGTPGTGTKLTSDSAAGIVEIDAMLQDRWDNYRLGPSHIFLNSQELASIARLTLGNGGSPLIRFAGDFGATANNMAAGAVVGSYLNKFAMNGGQMIKLMLHPNIPAGTMFAYSESLPYKVANVPNPAEFRYRQDWYQMEWPLKTRKYEYGVYADGTCVHYFPPSMGVITNIAPA